MVYKKALQSFSIPESTLTLTLSDKVSLVNKYRSDRVQETSLVITAYSQYLRVTQLRFATSLVSIT